MLQHGARVLERERTLECIVINEDIGADHQVEPLRLGQIDAFENDIKAYWLA